MRNPAASEPVDVRATILAAGQKIMAAKGFSGVGLNEILASAGVPKGSFYHYFASKEAFGEALLADYFDDYLAGLDATLGQPGRSMAQRLLDYFAHWQANQSFLDCQGKCLAVKLAAEVADLSEAMRGVLDRGTAAIIGRLDEAIEAGEAEGSLHVDDTPHAVAQGLYQAWMGASLMVKIVRGTEPFDVAMATTRQALHLPS
jgi:TetR/AcrR family transcriptional repressor of nem operon